MAEYDSKEDLQILKLTKPITLYYLDEQAARALITEPLVGILTLADHRVVSRYSTAAHFF
jgi:hypothetical protein